MRPGVLDASPVIVLARAGLVELFLSAAAQSGLVPSFLEALETAKRNGLYVAPEVEAALLER